MKNPECPARFYLDGGERAQALQDSMSILEQAAAITPDRSGPCPSSASDYLDILRQRSHAATQTLFSLEIVMIARFYLDGIRGRDPEQKTTKLGTSSRHC